MDDLNCRLQELGLNKTDVARVISESQNWDLEPQQLSGLDRLLKKWYEAKAPFIKDFGNRLIYEYDEPISLDLSDEDREKIYYQFVDSFLVNTDIIKDTAVRDRVRALFLAITKSEFFNNCYAKNVSSATNGQTLFFVGEKISKSLKKIIPDEAELRAVQDLYSQAIQEAKDEGILCISVHPLDFLSASDNACKWRSCHALDGEYRAGNLEYLMDSCTICCYLKSNVKKQITNFPRDIPWWSKKWRMWLYVNPVRSMMFAGRQYPFFSDDLLHKVTNIVKSLFNLYLCSDWSNTYKESFMINKTRYYLTDRYYPVNLYRNGETIFDLCKITDIVKVHKPELSYNDLLSSTCYDPMYYHCMQRGQLDYLHRYSLEDVQFHIGDEVPCPVCGAYNLDNSEQLCCERCCSEYGLYCD